MEPAELAHFEIILMSKIAGPEIALRRGARFVHVIPGKVVDSAIAFGVHCDGEHGDVFPHARHVTITLLRTGMAVGCIFVEGDTSATERARVYLSQLSRPFQKAIVEADGALGASPLACALWSAEQRLAFWKKKAKRLSGALQATQTGGRQ